MQTRPRVLVVHGSAEDAEQIAGGLIAACDARFAAISDLRSALEGEPAALVVAASPEVAGPVIEALAGVDPRPKVLFLCEELAPSALSGALDAGLLFSTLPRGVAPAALERHVGELLRPRVAGRHAPPAELVVEYSLPGSGDKKSGRLLDVSNRGVGVLLPKGDDLEPVFPGSQLRALTIVGPLGPVLDGVDAVVRYLGGVDDGYKVGCELVVRPGPSSNVPSEVLLDAYRVASVLRDAFRFSVFTIHFADEPASAVQVRGGSLDTKAGVLRLGTTIASSNGSAPEFQKGDVVQVVFERGGYRYLFYSSVLEPFGDASGDSERSPLGLVFPRSIRAIRQRSATRYRLKQGDAFTVSLTSPFDGRTVEGLALDIHSGGASIAVDDTTALPVGTLIPELILNLPGGNQIRATGRVRSMTPAGRPGQSTPTFKCGVSFDDLSSDDEALLGQAIIDTSLPGMRSGSDVSFQDLWKLLLTSGFIYPEKEESLKPVLPKIEQTLHVLMSRPNHVFKPLVFRDEEALRGHICLVRGYRDTWIAQHLATLKEARRRPVTALDLNLAVVEFLEQLPEGGEWCRVNFRPNNAWPMLVYGRFSKQMQEPDLSNVSTSKYLAASTSASLPEPPKSLEIRAAKPNELSDIEYHLVRALPLAVVRSQDLYLRELELDGISRHYRMLGLQRRREVAVALRNGELAAFALLEVSSPGLNFSELTNSFTLHSVNVDPEAAQALASWARYRYWELERPNCILLSPAQDIRPFEKAGFRYTKDYTAWTVHRTLFRRFYEYISHRLRRSR